MAGLTRLSIETTNDGTKFCKQREPDNMRMQSSVKRCHVLLHRQYRRFESHIGLSMRLRPSTWYSLLGIHIITWQDDAADVVQSYNKASA